MTSFQQVNYAPSFIQITLSDQTQLWSAFVSYQDGNNWVNLSSTSGIGNGTISVTVDQDPNYLLGSSPASSRNATITVTSLGGAQTMPTCLVSQQIYDSQGWNP